MISLRVYFPQTDQTKVMRFSLDIPVRDVIADIFEKTEIGGGDHGVFQPPVPGRSKGRWFKDNHTLKYYDLKTDADVQYKKKHRNLKVKLMDNTVKTVVIDDSDVISEICNIVTSKLKIKNPDEYSLRVDGRNENEWLNDKQGLHEQDVGEEDVLMLAKKFFFSDEQVDRTDPVQVHLIFVQCKEGILQSKYPVTKEEARDLSALQVQIEHGNHNPSIHKPKFLKLSQYVPKQYSKFKELEKDIFNEHKKLVGMSELNAKYRYIQLVRALKTYGITFFEVRERGKKRGKLVTTLLGITREKILRMDYETKEIIQEYPLVHLKQWAAARDTFTFDFGDHQDAYYTVQTPEAVQISQLIAGYIDIIIKNRQNSVKTLGNDGDGNIGEISDSNPIQVGVSHTQSQGQTFSPNTGGLQKGSTGGQPMMGQQFTQTKVPESQTISIRDLKTAKRVAELLQSELEEEAKLSNRKKTQNLGKSNLTDEQWTEQLSRANKDTSDILGQLMTVAMVDPNNFNKLQLDEAAKNLGTELDKLTKVAKGSSLGKDNLTQQAILEGARKAAEAVAEILELCERIQNNPYDDKAKEQLKVAERAFREAQLLLQNAQLGRINDVATEELIGETAKSLSKNIDDVVQCSIQAIKTLNDGQKMRDLNKSTKEVTQAKEALLSTISTLGLSLLDPEARKHIIDSSNSLAGLIAGLCSTVKDSGASPQFLQAIGLSAKNVNDSIQQLVQALDCAEEKGFEELMDFNGPFDRVSVAIGEMRVAGGDKQKLLDAVKMIALASNELVAFAKMVAELDPDSRDRILNTVNATAEAIARMVELAKIVAQNPDDVEARQNLIESAQKVQAITQELVVSAGKIGSILNLRAAAKMTATAAIALMSTAREVIQSIEDPNQKQKLLDELSNTQTSTSQLIEAIKQAAKNPGDIESQNQLLEMSSQVITTLAGLVAVAKVSSFNISDPNKKQLLQYSANDLGDRLKELIAACESFNSHEGHKEIDEALQKFDAIISNLESTEFRAKSGLLKPSPGQNRDNTRVLLDKAFQQLSECAKQVILSAKGEGGNLGPAALKAAEVALLVSTAIEAVSSTTPQKMNQVKVLQNAKKLVKDIANFIIACRAYNGRRGDPQLEQGVAKAYQQLKSSIASVLAVESGLDSSELDEVTSTLMSMAQKMQISPNPVLGYTEAIESLIQDIKALAAAGSQFSSLARTNPGALAPAAKILLGTCEEIISKIVQAGAHVDDIKGQEILNSTQNLISKVCDLLQAAKIAVASKTNESFQALDRSTLDLVSSISELEGLVSDSQNPQILFALNEILQALSSIDDLSNVPGGEVGQVIKDIQNSTSNLIGNSSKIARAGKVGTNKLGIYAKETSNDIIKIIDTVKSSQKQPENTEQTDMSQLSPEARAIQEAIKIIINNPTDNSKIVPATKQAAIATATLMQIAKELAQRTTDKNKQAAILRAAKQLAICTTELAKAAKAPKDENGVKALIKAANDLLNFTMQLENAKSEKSLDDDVQEMQQSSGVPPIVSSQLMTVAKILAVACTSFLTSVGQLSQNPKDQSQQNQLVQSSKQYAQALKDMINVTLLLNPGVQKIKQSEKEIEKSVGELDQVLIDSQVGNINQSMGRGKTFPQCQEALVNLCKSFTNDISNLVSSVSQGPEKVGEVGEIISGHIKDLVLTAKAAAATTTDQALQGLLLSQAKLLAEALGSLLNECSSSEPDQNNIISKSKECSSIIGELVSAIKANTVIFKDLESSIGQVQQLLTSMDRNAQPSGQTYSKIKESISPLIRVLNSTSTQLNSTDKSNVGQVGLNAKELGNTLAPLIEAMKDAIATTTDTKAKNELKKTAKALVSNVIQLMNGAKAIGNNPMDTQGLSSLNEGYKNLIKTSIPDFLQAVKGGDLSAKQIEDSIAKIQESTSKLNTSFYYSKSGQLEKPKTQTTIPQLVTQLTNTSNDLSTKSSQLGNSQSMTTEQLAPLISQISTIVENLSNSIIEVAGKTKDTQSQQEILSAGQAVAITLQQLALAAQNANRNKDDETAGELLNNSVQSVNNSINDLISVVQSSTAQSNRGNTELENTSNQIRLILTQNIQDPNPSILNVVEGAKKCTEAIATLVFATSQEDIVNGAKIAEEAIKAILSNISAKAPNQNVQRALLEAAQNSSRAMLDLLNTVKSGDRDNPQTKTQIQTKGEDLTSLLNELVGVCNKYPEAMSMTLVEDNLELKAEQQLLNALEMIKKAAQELSLTTVPEKNKKERTFGQVVGLEVDDYEISTELLEAVKEVVSCGSILLECAIIAQSERKEQNKNNIKYRNDPTWANGLISSSKSVAQSLMLLVRACNAAVRGELEDEAIIALSSTVAAATAQLITASRVRANPNSKAQKDLDISAKQVAKSTDKMVKTAKKFTELREKLEDTLPSNPNLINKLEQQMDILRLEKQLEQARRNLGKINKDEYNKNKNV